MTGSVWLALGLLIGALGGVAIARMLRPRAPRRHGSAGDRRIVFPFSGTSITQRALDATLRLAEAEGATLMPVYLARVPLRLPLDAPLPRQGRFATELLETIDQVASRRGIPVDARIERGRSVRHALRELVEHESFYRMVVATATREHDGLEPEDIAWALRYMPGEIVALRPGDTPIADLPAHLTRSVRFTNWFTGRRTVPMRSVAHTS